MKFHGFQDTDLIPELPEWKKLNGEAFSISDWAFHFVTCKQFIAHASLFYPEFAESHGGVFFKSNLEHLQKTEPHTLENLAKNLTSFVDFQMLVNHRHIIEDLFASAQDAGNATLVQVKFIGKILLDIWGMTLKNQFPHLTVQLELEENEGFDYIITFWAEPKTALST